MPLLVFVARQVPSTAPGTGSSGCEKVSLPSKLAGFWRLEPARQRRDRTTEGRLALAALRRVGMSRTRVAASELVLMRRLNECLVARPGERGPASSLT